MKILLLTNDIKWKTLESRTRALELYFRGRFDFIYEELTIDIKPFKTDLYPNANGELDDMWIQNRMIKPNPKYDAVGMLINPKQWLKSGGKKNLLGGYVRDNDMKFGFYIICDEKQTRTIKRKKYEVFENTFEHELAGHGVSHDLGLKWESNDVHSFKEGYDNTHYFFYNNKIDEHYEYIKKEAKKVTDKMESKLQVLKDKIAQFGKKEVSSTNTPNSLLPLLECKFEALKTISNLIYGYEIRMVSGFRSFDEQNALYEKGRTKIGNIVTNAKGGQSMHNYGVAIDYCFVGDEPYPPENSIKWKQVNHLAELLGFYSYGNELNWDYGHIQFMLDYTEKDFMNGKVDYKRYL